MIDIHCHILPNLDDGSKSVAESMKMAQKAAKDGIYTIVATPHHLDGRYNNTGHEVEVAVQALNEALEDENIPVTIVPGHETRINGDMVERLERNEILPLNAASKYVFVELPSNHVPHYTNQLFFDMQVAGYTPVIVHPERNSALIQKPDQLYSLVKSGALTQVTAASATGKFGKKIQKFTKDILEANLTHFVASDAHNTTSRGFHLLEAYEHIKKTFGNEMVFQLMENTERLMEGQAVVGDQPHRITQKKFFGLLKK
ncbi:tyrosine protein phosphatase [Virgibacillus sp. MSP4-1]|uniref:tyrosine-protein phosphatase n=1 Tax=Virgibacillus sp. MSP4-1 TaxID=2700081 RepID=UPI000399CEF6|nr:CpsB/CapC family capsule biosynthesis tyrosine phosphatase [Virgibacillus sp. MSP4-1]QHS23485.1 tyrosine protein phosphatase [Virgibacillus sp. MSP4-1]